MFLPTWQAAALLGGLAAAALAACRHHERPAPGERQQLTAWAEYRSLSERARAAGGDPVVRGELDRYLKETEERYGLTVADLSRLGATQGERWLASAACRPPAGPIRMHALVVAPRAVRPLRAAYTPAACARGTEGIAILELLVSPEGRADTARVLRGLPDGLTEAAQAAAEAARWHPALLCGKPVAVFYIVTVRFDLPQSGCPKRAA